MNDDVDKKIAFIANMFDDTFDEIDEYEGYLIAVFGEDEYLNYYETELFDAIVLGNTDMVMEFLKMYSVTYDAIALHHAVLANNPEMIETLVEFCEIDIESTDNRGSTALFLSASKGYEDCFDILVKNGADMKTTDYDGRTLAHHALFSGDLDFMKSLQEKGVIFDVNKVEDALIPLAGAETEFDVLDWLINDLKGDVNFQDEDGNSALFYACLWEQTSNAVYLIKQGAECVRNGSVCFAEVIKSIQELDKENSGENVLSFKAKKELKRLRSFAKKL